MRRHPIKTLVLIGVLAGVTVSTASSSVIVTNPAPAVAASMQLVSSDGQCFTWQVTGKLKPSYRGFGAEVRLICGTPESLAAGGATPGFSNCDGPCPPALADACGNFSFSAVVCGSPQLDPSHVCFFTVHLDTTRAPNACNKSAPPDAFPQDPNGTAPCSGGLCPDAP